MLTSFLFKKLIGVPQPPVMNQFTEWCTRVRSFSDDAYSEQPLLARSSLAGLFRSRRQVFPYMEILRVNVANLRAPLLSPSVTDLTVLISEPVHGDEYVLICSNLKSAPPSLPNVKTLRIDGDDHLENFHRPLAKFCTSFPGLQTLILAPSALSPFLLRALSTIDALVAVRVLECARSYELGYRFDIGAQISGGLRRFADGSFRALRSFSFTSSSVEAALSLLCMPTYPSRNLAVLWIKFPTGSYFDPGMVKELLGDMASVCLALEHLTLRFGSYGALRRDPMHSVTQLSFTDIDPILLFPRLRCFFIDHYLCLSFTADECDRLAAGGSRFEELWLNPFPSVHPTLGSRGSFRVGWLSKISRGCPRLRRLGVVIEGTNFRYDGGEVNTFEELRELFVGSSPIATLRNGDDSRCRDWEHLGIFFSRLLGRRGRLQVVEEQDEAEMFMMESSGMRATGGAVYHDEFQLQEESYAWRIVSGMITFLREIGSPGVV